MLTYLKYRRQRCLLPIWLILVSYGLDFELSAFYTLEGTATSVFLVLVGLALIGLYAVPAVWGLLKALKAWSVDKRLVCMALLSGLFITGWLASYGNDWLGQLWKAILPESIYTSWEAALTAPLVEEVLKTAFAFFCLYFYKQWDKKSVFTVGLATGLGFQIIEDVAYVVTESSMTSDSGFVVAISRLTGMLASHYLYSSLITLGIYLLATKAKDVPTWKIYLWAFGPLVLHFIWNSPLNMLGVSAVLSGLSLYLLVDAIGYVFEWNFRLPSSALK